MDEEESITGVRFDHFSSELLVEYIVQYLESLPHHRHYNGNLPENLANDDKRLEMKKWLRLGDTLVNCLKHDLKHLKVASSEVDHHGKPMMMLEDRKAAVHVVCKWTQDLHTLRDMYFSNFKDKQGMIIAQHTDTERMCKDVESLFYQLDWLCELANIIYKNETIDENKKDGKSEVVFLFN